MEKTSLRKDAKVAEYLLTHNETELKVHIDLVSMTAKTDIRRRFLAAKVPNTASELYTEALKIMHAEAASQGRDLRYILATRNRSMMAWADSSEKGRRLFNWETFEMNNGTLVAEATISADTNSTENL